MAGTIESRVNNIAASGGGGGGVSSVGLKTDATTASIFTNSGNNITGSPVTTSGNFTLTLSDQSANQVLAGPTSGAATTPAFRSIVAADIPTLNQNTTGTALNVTGTVAIANGGTGQTTQAAAITALAGTQSSGQYLRSNGTNTLLAAIQAADVPTLNQSTSGSAASLSATLVVGSGGTGNTTFTAYSVICAGTTATGVFQNVSGLGSSGNVLTSNGPGTPPTWQASSGSSPLTTKGDLFGFSTVNARIAVGGTDGIALTVDSTNANGVSYATNYVRVGAHTTTFIFDDGSVGELSFKGSANQSIMSNQADGIHFTTNSIFDALLYSDGTWQTNKQMVAGATTLARPGYNFGFSNSGLHFQGTNQVSLVTNSLIGLSVDANQNVGVVGSFDFTYQRVASATSAGSTTINNNISVLVLHAAGTLTTYTVTMPATPIDGQIIQITCNQAITTLTLSPNTSQTIIGAPATLAAGGGINYIWVNTDSLWYPL